MNTPAQDVRTQAQQCELALLSETHPLLHTVVLPSCGQIRVSAETAKGGTTRFFGNVLQWNKEDGYVLAIGEYMCTDCRWRTYLLSSTTRSYTGCVGRASFRYSRENCWISSAVIVVGCFS